MARETVDTFVKNYHITEPMKPAERGAKFLNDLAMRYPGDFVSKPKLAKVMFNLPSVPRDNNECMKRVPGTLQAVDRILFAKYQRKVKADRVDGYRATSSDADLVVNVVRVQVRRAHMAQERVNKTIAMVNPRNLTGPLKAEVENVRNTFKIIADKTSQLPQLPPKRTEGPNSPTAR